MNTDHIYWTFSAASQSISAFVAFLIAGYTLVIMIMDAARDRDDSLGDIHDALKIKYHKYLTNLAWIFGTAIISSLIIVYLNQSNENINLFLLLLVGIVDLISIVGGLVFVILITDPEKYKREAQKELELVSEQVIPVTSSPAAEFFDAFLRLERLLRNYLNDREFLIQSRNIPREPSFREMVEALRMNEVIDQEFYQNLNKINKYRNLVFHAHITEVDSQMIERARQSATRIQNLV